MSIVPFIIGKQDKELAEKYFPKESPLRIHLSDLIKGKFSNVKNRLWIDTCFDALSQSEIKDSGIKTLFRKIDPEGILRARKEWKAPSRNKEYIHNAIVSLLDEAMRYGPTFITVPQLPYVNNAEKNRINKLLMQVTNRWFINQKNKPRMVLPVIFTSQQQYLSRTVRKDKLKFIKAHMDEMQADSLWVVDKSLDDQAGTSTFSTTRLPALLDFHIELRVQHEDVNIIAGPYWAVGLVLWCRNLIDSIAIRCGGSYQYIIPGGQASTPKSRVACSSLKRTLVMAPSLRKWLKDNIAKKTLSRNSLEELQNLYDNFDNLKIHKIGKEQTAKFYSEWINRLTAQPHQGRSIALYQDFSSAFVEGKSMTKLPEQVSKKRPEKTAEQMMLICL